MFLMTVALTVFARTMLRFGIENVSTEEMNDDDYIHQDLTRQACTRYYGGPMPAASSIIWHTDYIDSYLYSPFFWAGGIFSGDGIDRLKVSACLKDDLEALHFDDLTSVEQIEQMWTRYLGGSIAGLVWAAQRRDVAAAHNILGATLHPIQDFYAHSSWVDDARRRAQPWHAMPPSSRAVANVYTGSYETAEHLSQRPHGKVSVECSVMRAIDVSPIMDIACSGYSPLNKLTPCQVYDRCTDAEAVSTSVLGIQLPRGLVYLDPPGIALDSSWQAKIARQVRDIPAGDPITAEDLYAGARELAVLSSVWWLQTAGSILRDMGHGAFWQEVLTTDTYGSRRQQFEDFSRLPFRFVSATPYPPMATTATPADWYLRLTVRTASETDSGTNGTVAVRAEGLGLYARDRRWTELNYGKNVGPVLEYNDLSTGDVQTYMIGPFTELPSALTFRVQGSNVGDVLSALWDSFVDAVDSVVTALGDFFLSIIGGHADFVAQRTVLWSPAQLEAIGYEGVEFREFLDGDDEGQYNLFGTIRRVDDPGAPHRHRTYEVSIDRLQCWEESTELSERDEPFLLALLINLADHHPRSRVQPFRTAPYSVNRRETVTVGHRFLRVHVPEGSGMLALPIAVYESDQETAAARDRLLAEFAGAAETSTQSSSDRLVEAVGALFGSDWKLGGLEVFAFRHAPSSGRAGTVVSADVERWIERGTTWTVDLTEPEQWSEWRLPDHYSRGLGVMFSHRARAAFDAGDLASSTREMSLGVGVLREQTAGGRPAPLGEVRDETAAWLTAAQRAHPNDVPAQVAAADNAWQLARYLAERDEVTADPRQVGTLARWLRQLVGLRTFGTPGSGTSVETAHLTAHVWTLVPGDQRVQVAELWSALALRHHETAFHPEVRADPARQSQELAAQREVAQHAAAVAYPLALEPASANDPLLATVLRRLVGVLTFGSPDSAPSVEAAEHAARVWARIPDSDRRYELAELWTALSLRHHETAVRPEVAADRVAQAAEFTKQRARAEQATQVAFPLAQGAVREAIRSPLARVLQRLSGLLLTGADPTAPETARLRELAATAQQLHAQLS